MAKISFPFLSAKTNKRQKLLNLDIVWFASKQSNGNEVKQQTDLKNSNI